MIIVIIICFGQNIKPKSKISTFDFNSLENNKKHRNQTDSSWQKLSKIRRKSRRRRRKNIGQLLSKPERNRNRKNIRTNKSKTGDNFIMKILNMRIVMVVCQCIRYSEVEHWIQNASKHKPTTMTNENKMPKQQRKIL